MSTLAEIEAAMEKLPAAEQKALPQFIAERVHRSEALADDPVIAVIGPTTAAIIPRAGCGGHPLRSRWQPVKPPVFLDTGAIFVLADAKETELGSLDGLS